MLLCPTCLEAFDSVGFEANEFIYKHKDRVCLSPRITLESMNLPDEILLHFKDSLTPEGPIMVNESIPRRSVLRRWLGFS